MRGDCPASPLLSECGVTIASAPPRRRRCLPVAWCAVRLGSGHDAAAVSRGLLVKTRILFTRLFS